MDIGQYDHGLYEGQPVIPPRLVLGGDIFILGEAPGKSDSLYGRCFSGTAGKLLRSCLDRAKINFEDCSHGNVFQVKPPDTATARNDLSAWCGPRGEMPREYSLPALNTGKYVRPVHLWQVNLCLQQIAAARPKIVIALGNTACWATLGLTGITKLRGFVHGARAPVPGLKVLPTYHPAAVLRRWETLPIMAVDLIKAQRESSFADIRRPERTIYIPESIADISEWFYHNRGPRCSVDIETAHGGITCIGFSYRKDSALVIPFEGPNDGSYWATLELEQRVWEVVKLELGREEVEWLFQNGLYDLTYIIYQYGVRLRGRVGDLMFAQHAYQPELPKSLSHLGSIYTGEPAWKLMRLEFLKGTKAGDVED